MSYFDDHLARPVRLYYVNAVWLRVHNVGVGAQVGKIQISRRYYIHPQVTSLTEHV